MKRLVFDLDGTIAADVESQNYECRPPIVHVADKIRQYREEGWEIVIATARGMRSCSNSVGTINARMLPVIVRWLDQHRIPYDEIHVGKPWCGTEGFYIDDRAVRPSEFVTMHRRELEGILFCERETVKSWSSR